MSAEKRVQFSVLELAKATRQASIVAAQLSSETKRALLLEFAHEILNSKQAVEAANAKDVEKAEANGLRGAMLERLRLTEKVIDSMVVSLREVAELPDPVGSITGMNRRPNGMLVGKMRIPLGVIGIIYESRPNVTSDAAGLCLKAGNACILRGGSESLYSNLALANVFHEVLNRHHLPPALVTVIPIPDREVMLEMLTLEDEIDLIIPRGGEGLIRFVAQHSRIPVIKHYKGVCHQYVDAGADPEMATNLIANGKAQRPGVCNATETLLVHKDSVETCLEPMARKLVELGVELRACQRTYKKLSQFEIPQNAYKLAVPEDFGMEFLDYILAVRVVDSFEEAVTHIQQYGSNHTETIVTNDHARAMRFLKEVNSSVVMINASTRFADGHQLGLGAEIGISTTKLHAFGPMGVEELTTLKFIVMGDGQVRTWQGDKVTR